MFRKALIAVVVGATCGAAAAYWSRPADNRHRLPTVVSATIPLAAPARPTGRPPAAPAALPPALQQRRIEPVTRAADETADPVQRARLLAQRPDVKGLVALREQMVRRAEEAGERESPATKVRLDQIDRYLAEARVLRLKLDAAEFRTTVPDEMRPR
jgi:hypothetical protein